MDDIKRHWDIRSSDYNDFVVRGFSLQRERRAWQDHFTSILGSEPLDILDVGCGPGIVSMQLADIGHRMTSVDLSDRMLEHAVRNAADNGLSIDFMQADAMALPFEDESFGAVVSDYMLWTVPDPEKVISEWYRVLRPGCRLVYTDGDWFNDPRMTPFRCAVSSMFVRLGKGRSKTDTEREESSMDLWSSSAVRPRDDVRMLEAAGFEEIRIIDDVQRKVLHGTRYLAHGLTNNHFTVTAVKPKA